MVSADGSARDVPVNKLPAVLGRADDCRVRIPLPSVSRRHCELRITDDELVVRDLKSSNGTHVNSQRIRQRELVPGDLLAVGPVVFVVRIDGHPKEIDARECYAAGAVEIEPIPGGSAGVPAWPGIGGGGAPGSGGTGGGVGDKTRGGTPAPGKAAKPDSAEGKLSDLLKDFDFGDEEDKKD